MNKKEKVFVGVSGGVDSSVAAALLIDAGYDVTGVFIRTWTPEWTTCTWRDERRDAMRVCAHLGIPFLECDAEEAYKRGVADYMIDEYKRGRTPNPDVMCNREVKFGVFWKFAKVHGADYIATGHYARAERRQLLAGIDPSKDQSYFLWTLTEDDLSHTLFPVGRMYKDDVRLLAKKYDLPTATKKDSQGVCFLGPLDMKEFLRHYIAPQPGNVLDEKGDTIGMHEGALFYTIGERHGFTIHAKRPDSERLYVIAKDVDHNTITVGSEHPDTTSTKKTVALDSTIVRSNLPPFVDAVIRYHGARHKATFDSKTSLVTFLDAKIPEVAPGQSVVLYDGEMCVGGGVVK